MALPITQDQVDAFRQFCREQIAEAYADGDAVAGFCISMYPEFEREGVDGEPLWEFHAGNYDPVNSHDIYELFGSVAPEFTIEVHGYDDFYIIPRAGADIGLATDDEIAAQDGLDGNADHYSEYDDRSAK